MAATGKVAQAELGISARMARPARGHRNIWATVHDDGHVLSEVTALRLLRDEGLIPPAHYQRRAPQARRSAGKQHPPRIRLGQPALAAGSTPPAAALADWPVAATTRRSTSTRSTCPRRRTSRTRSTRSSWPSRTRRRSSVTRWSTTVPSTGCWPPATVSRSIDALAPERRVGLKAIAWARAAARARA